MSPQNARSVERGAAGSHRARGKFLGENARMNVLNIAEYMQTLGLQAKVAAAQIANIINILAILRYLLAKTSNLLANSNKKTHNS